MDKIDLKILQAGIAIKTTETKVKLSLEEIKEKHPGREDIIKSMSETLNDVRLVKETLTFLSEKYDVSDLILHKQSVDIQNLRAENERLKTEVENVKKNLTL